MSRVSVSTAFDEGVSAARRGWQGLLAYVLLQWAGGFFLLIGVLLYVFLQVGIAGFQAAAEKEQLLEKFSSGSGAAGLLTGFLFFACLGLVFYTWLQASKTFYMARVVRGEPAGWDAFFRMPPLQAWRAMTLLFLTILIALAAALFLAGGFVLPWWLGAGKKAAILLCLLWGFIAFPPVVYGATRLSFGLTALSTDDLSAWAALKAGWASTEGLFWRALLLFLLYCVCLGGVSLLLGLSSLGFAKLGVIGEIGQTLIQFAFAGLSYFATFALSGMLCGFYNQATADRALSQ